MPLYGHELTEEIDPFQAGLGFAVDLDGRTFPGTRRARQAARATRTSHGASAGLLDGKRVPREGYPVYRGDEPVGRRHQRHVLAHARAADRDGLRAAVDLAGALAPKSTIDIRGSQRAVPVSVPATLSIARTVE